jgi:hypothetical protein
VFCKLLVVSCVPLSAAAQSDELLDATSPAITDEILPTSTGKPFIDMTFDSFTPRGPSTGPFASQPAAGFNVGLQPLKYLQIDGFGLSVIPSGLASNGRQVYVSFSDGPRLARWIDDSSILITTGARMVLPLWQRRILLSAGGGWAGLFVTEQIEAPYNPYVYDDTLTKCYSCQSRHGWGPTAVAEAMVFPGVAHGVGFGFHVRTVQIHSDGISFRKPASLGSNDRFLMIGGTVSIRFGH